MRTPERAGIFLEPKKEGIAYRVPAAQGDLWQKVSDSLDDQLVAGLLKGNSLSRYIGPEKKPVSLYAYAQAYPVDIMELAVLAYHAERGFSFQLAGKMHFAPPDRDTGVYAVAKHLDRIAGLLRDKQINANIVKPADRPPVLALSSSGNLITTFTPIPNQNEKTFGGIALLVGKTETGDKQDLSRQFSVDMTHFLNAAAYITDAIQEWQRVTPRTKIVGFVLE